MTRMNWARVHTEDRQHRYWNKRRHLRATLAVVSPARHRRPSTSRRTQRVVARLARSHRSDLRSCPYCAVALNPKNYFRHTTKRCPNRPRLGGIPAALHPSNDGLRLGAVTTPARCDICNRRIDDRDVDAHFERHRGQWSQTGSVAPLVRRASNTKPHKTQTPERHTKAASQAIRTSAGNGARRGKFEPVPARASGTEGTKFAVCVDGRRRRFLKTGKLYRIRPSANGCVHVRDDSGDERTYPSALFMPLKVSRGIQRALTLRVRSTQRRRGD
jgi:hypothetical protein